MADKEFIASPKPHSTQPVLVRSSNSRVISLTASAREGQLWPPDARTDIRRS